MTDWTPPADNSGSLEWEHIATTVLASPAVSISFTGFSTDYRMFRLPAFFIKDATTQTINLRFNNDSGNNYAYQTLLGDGALSGARQTAFNAIQMPSSITANSFALYRHQTISKPSATTIARVDGLVTKIVGGAVVLQAFVGLWTNVSGLLERIDLLSVSGSLDTGSRATLGGARNSL